MNGLRKAMERGRKEGRKNDGKTRKRRLDEENDGEEEKNGKRREGRKEKKGR